MDRTPINNAQVGAVILAAGKGTRLNCTDKPKVMCEINDKPLVAYTVETLKKMGYDRRRIIMVVGFCQEKVRTYFGDTVEYAEQTEQRGTADAAYVGMRALPKDVTNVLVLGGDDSAFYRPETLETFVKKHIDAGVVLSLLTVEKSDPDQYGRIIRHPNDGIEIIEKEYLTEEQKKIKEISTGTFCFDRVWFEKIFPTMPRLRKLGEFGLPTALAIARTSAASYQTVSLPDPDEWFGVNTPEELVEADRRKRII